MATYTAFLLRPKSPFHVGTEGVGLEGTGEYIHSDTLFSALCHAWLQLGMEIPKPDKAPLLSSVFPMVTPLPLAEWDASTAELPIDDMIFFFPRLPLSSEEFCGRALSLQEEKRWAEAGWISQKALEILRSESDRSDITLAGNGPLIVHKEEANQPALSGVLWQSGLNTIRPRVAVDRLQNRSNLYHLGCTRYGPSTGLYFLCSGDETQLNNIEKALVILGDCGIGGERTYGYGHFQYLGRYPLEFSEVAGDIYLLLSLFHPADTVEVQRALAPPARYYLMERRGYIDSPEGRSYRRQRLLMVAEGSCLAAQVLGSIPDALPQRTRNAGLISHPVYRYGRAFTLPGAYYRE